MNFRFGTFALLLILVGPCLQAEDIPLQSLKNGEPVPESESPDGKLFLLEVSQDAPATTSVVIAKRDRSKYLALVPIPADWNKALPVGSLIKALWNENSSLVATHHGIGEKCRMTLFQVKGEKTEPLPLPDLLKAACEANGIARNTVTASGFRPGAWETKETLVVHVRITTREGRRKTIFLRLNIDPMEGPRVLGHGQ